MVTGNKAKIRGVSWNITRLVNRIPSLKKEHIYPVVAYYVLFSLFFVFGATGNSNGTIPLSTKPTTTRLEDCLQERRNSKPLDCRSTHDAVSNFPTHALNSSAARGFHTPPCPANMSEYTPCQDVKRPLGLDRERHFREGSSEEPMRWPESRDWECYSNVPHKELTVEKTVENWAHFDSDRFKLPRGGTMIFTDAYVYIYDTRRAYRPLWRRDYNRR